MRRFRPYLVALAILSAAVLPTAAQAEDAATPLINDLLAEVGRVQQQITSLAEAMPADISTWRPSEGVRSVSETYLHIAFGNYMLLQVVGHSPPAELADRLAFEKIPEWDTQTTDKAAVAEIVAGSFDHLTSTLATFTAEELENPVEFFGMNASTRQMLLLALGHLHEHLGQQIAYARMNGVVPPWTAAEQAAAAEADAGDGY